MIVNEISLNVRRLLRIIQSILSFESWGSYPQFNTKHGLGRIALIALGLGIAWGVHFVLLTVIVLEKADLLRSNLFPAFLSSARMQLASQWCTYIMCVSTFHFAEFFATATHNPSVVSSESFLVNHSYAYTGAFILSSTEFLVRFIFFPRINSSPVAYFGLATVIVAQTVRTGAIVICGESFNHLIQTSKKENHRLITRGIYKYLRHPSYFGFFYWSIGTQVLLCNPIHSVLVACASWYFFQRRIPYEEESLRQHFPEAYPKYAAQTWIGIPFLKSPF